MSHPYRNPCRGCGESVARRDRDPRPSYGAWHRACYEDVLESLRPAPAPAAEEPDTEYGYPTGPAPTRPLGPPHPVEPEWERW